MLATPMGKVALLGQGGAAYGYDVVQAITAAYALRRLRTPYTGSLVRLLRNTDSVESDFGYVANGDLDTAAIATWLAGDTGLIKTIYDQSGNNYHITQATKSRLPLYVASGQNSKPVMRFDATDDRLACTMSPIPDFATAISVLAVASRVNQTSNDRVLLDIGNGSFDTIYMAANTTGAGAGRWSFNDYNGSPHGLYGVAATANSWTGMAILEGSYNNPDWTIWKNGAQVTTVANGRTATNYAELSIGGFAGGGRPLNGDVAEIIILNAAWSAAQRQAAESAANNYWQIY